MKRPARDRRLLPAIAGYAMAVALSAAAPLLAQNETPSDSFGVIFEPYRFSVSNGVGNACQTALEHQHYGVLRVSTTAPGTRTNPPGVTILGVISRMLAGYGVFTVHSHGNTDAWGAETYQTYLDRERAYLQLVAMSHIIDGVDIRRFNADNTFGIAMRAPGMRKWFRNRESIVFNSSCSGGGYSASWGARAVLDYPGVCTVSASVADARYFFERMDGQHGDDERMVLDARPPGMLITGNPLTVLSPIVTDYAPLVSGVQAGHVVFDTKMDTTQPPQSLVTATNAVLTNHRWIGDNRIEFNVTYTGFPNRFRVGAFHSQSRNNGVRLDGNDCETGPNGRGPNEDDFCWTPIRVGGGGLGTHIFPPSDVVQTIRSATGAPVVNLWGVTRDSAGNLYVTSPRAFSGPHMLHVLDPAGSYVRSIPQPTATRLSLTGIRDLAYDPAAGLIYGGAENPLTGGRLFAYDVNTGMWNPNRDVLLTGPSIPATTLALAFDPSGDGGQGSFWMSDATGNAVEVSRRTGTVLRSVLGIQPSISSASYDPGSGNVWWFGQGGSSRPSGGAVALEMETATGSPTGLGFHLDMPGGGQGQPLGAEIVTQMVGGQPKAIVTAVLSHGSGTSVLHVDPEFTYATSCGGDVGLAFDPAYLGNANFAVTLGGSQGSLGFLVVSLRGTAPQAMAGLLGAGCIGAIDPSGALTFLTTIDGGFAQVRLPIPSNNALRDLILYLQWVASGNPLALPLQTSSAGALTIK